MFILVEFSEGEDYDGNWEIVGVEAAYGPYTEEEARNIMKKNKYLRLVGLRRF